MVSPRDIAWERRRRRRRQEVVAEDITVLMDLLSNSELPSRLVFMAQPSV